VKDEFWKRVQGSALPDVFNPWGAIDPLDVEQLTANLHRTSNLIMHLAVEPRFILIGEAPGYRGCHFSGIPFTSEKQIFNHEVPYLPSHERMTMRPRPWSEPSASIVWRNLRELNIVDKVILWNAFPWHPYKAARGYLSNRTPTRAELIGNADVLKMLLDEKNADGVRIVAIGNSADYTLRHLGVYPDRIVRHPSMGGARAFSEQLAAIVNE
jgi:uracil-DNA glycosylase